MGISFRLMTKPADKFEATRIVTQTIQEFDPKDQAMIFRWAAETLGLPEPFHAPTTSATHSFPTGPQVPPRANSTVGPETDIDSFVKAKNPRSDVQFAATVAYFYQFVAPESERKASLSAADLVDACRKAGWKRPKNPSLTLHNAFHAGLLDKADKGSFSLNAVGENLVALTLPGTRKSEIASAANGIGANGRKRPRKAASTKRASAKKRA
ncbi:MAG TPA: hypothetical protein VNX26_02635 [Candidatus Acidoferrum sp.]|nr:hypothetical protein [Candidatus Acidoferrum sp.]